MRGAALLAAALTVTATGSAATGDVWKQLHRPLHVPHIAPGAPCPVATRMRALHEYGIGIGFGRGPAYPVGLNENGKPVLRFYYPIPKTSVFYGSKWSGNKVLWAVTPDYTRPVLIRGRQLDGPNLLRFDGIGFRVPPAELRVRPGGTPITNRPSETRVRVPGCYGYQVDGVTFSYVIVFEAKLAP